LMIWVMSVVSEQMASDQKVNGSIAQNADDADICGCQTKQSLNKLFARDE